MEQKVCVCVLIHKKACEYMRVSRPSTQEGKKPGIQPPQPQPHQLQQAAAEQEQNYCNAVITVLMITSHAFIRTAKMKL